MTSRTQVICALTAAALLLLSACDREKRIGDVPARIAAPASLVLDSARKMPFAVTLTNPFEGNHDAAREGKRLFSDFNCAGCHSPGGGGAIGPPLIDGHWIYGGGNASVFESIAAGRPQGMPAFGARVSEYQVWQLVTYVRGMNRPPKSEAKPPHL